MDISDIIFGSITVIVVSAVIVLFAMVGFAVIFQILLPYPANYVAFCNEMGLEYHHSWTFPIGINVTCSRVIDDCPANNCKLIAEKIVFNNYPEKIGEVVR